MTLPATVSGAPRTVFDWIWDAHVVQAHPAGQRLLWIDRHFTHEGSFHAYGKLAGMGRRVARPDLTFGVADHYVPTRNRDAEPADPDVGRVIRLLRDNTAANAVRLFDLGDEEQGIVHVVGPEQGLTLPGLTIVCGDSHTSTHGAFGALAFGIGASEVAHVLATQTLWQRRPKTFRVRVDGRLGAGVSAKDLILHLISVIGTDGATGHVIEYAGPAIRALGMEARMTVCNMSIEAGARAGMIAPDETTFAWLKGRPAAPAGALFDRAVAHWSALRSDDEAVFDREIVIDGSAVAPVVTWGTAPEEAVAIDGHVPGDADPATLDYMGLVPGQKLDGLPVDRVFIGSCTNGRIEDLRAAAALLKGRRLTVPMLVSPGSTRVKRQAEAEGLARIFVEAGADWVESGCSMCVGMNGDLAAPGERVASTTNRNFRGRQGPGARTHLMSPAMAAAAGVTGRLADIRRLAEG